MKFQRRFQIGLGVSLVLISAGSYAIEKSKSASVVAPPQYGPLVVPGYLAAQEFYTSSGTFRDPERSQQVYGAEQFGSRPILIRAIYWRPSPNDGSAFKTTIQNIQVNLSTTSKQEDQLSTTFEENVGRDDTVVFKGPLRFSSRFVNGPGGTKRFDMMIPLRHPFRYDPTRGNLLVDIRNFSGSTVASQTDAYGVHGDGCSRVVSLDPNSPTATFSDTAVDPLETIFTRVRFF